MAGKKTKKTKKGKKSGKTQPFSRQHLDRLWQATKPVMQSLTDQVERELRVLAFEKAKMNAAALVNHVWRVNIRCTHPEDGDESKVGLLINTLCAVAKPDISQAIRAAQKFLASERGKGLYPDSLILAVLYTGFVDNVEPFPPPPVESVPMKPAP